MSLKITDDTCPVCEGKGGWHTGGDVCNGFKISGAVCTYRHKVCPVCNGNQQINIPDWRRDTKRGDKEKE
jgi:RNA polymerase subunit RPABC4/transcription elongation factor Spt4